MTNHKVETCGGCGREHWDTVFGIFALSLWPVEHGRRMKIGLVKDKYFCDQNCLDAYCGIIRGPDGGVISEGPRYQVKQRFRKDDNGKETDET